MDVALVELWLELSETAEAVTSKSGCVLILFEMPSSWGYQAG